MKVSSFNAIAVFAAVSAIATAATAQERLDIGKREFDNNCAVCHGATAKGNGPLAGLINQKIPDITQIQKDNQGIFPFERVYEIIDGRETVGGAHGTRDMPVWGKEYSTDADDWLGYYYVPQDVENFVRGRILALIGYISRLQEQ